MTVRKRKLLKATAGQSTAGTGLSLTSWAKARQKAVGTDDPSRPITMIECGFTDPDFQLVADYSLIGPANMSAPVLAHRG